ncbi:GNAT family N-acetyltransferase [Ornithinimicrobium faecis]|uniref:GNAT family N-acetyltransferase n=1 Tax=Ornithinimicrobium faecis TaxID=2934158 RepID=UPI0021197EE8|nr:GNAT family N-acetyltransferase [Ornithinimicrobium sp. HY1745]
MSITIRQATAADLPGLARLRWTWSKEGQQPLDCSFDEYARDFADWYQQHEGFVAYVAADGPELVAMGFLALASRVPDPRSFHRRTGDIQSMFVLPRHRNRGIGARVVERLVRHGRTSGCTRITVHSGGRAIPLYSRAGFAAQPNLLMLTIH